MILHVMILDKFLPPFIDFVDKNFGRGEHKYVFITAAKYHFGLTVEHNVEFLHTDEDIFVTLESYMGMASKILLHGLWRDKVNALLISNYNYLNKSYWLMWGGDYYYPANYSNEQLYIMENVPYMVNILDEDINFVRRVYGAKGKHIRSFVYTTNVFKKNRPFSNFDGCSRILLGHSAARDLRHIEYLKRISYKDEGSLEVFCPLSYPKNDLRYIDEVISSGYNLFSERFHPLQNFIPLEEYREWLTGICFAVFPSSRQHGMSNMIDLIGHGCKVFLDKDVSTWSFFSRVGVTIYPLDELNFSPIATNLARENSERIQNYFSEKRLLRDLSVIFSMELGQDIQLEEL
ncbi:MAG: TDP-N-acetylfucosamine:lipid II N-acetylfucosaminyltransferase [Gammaproteobacteria bacterium]|nr:TDP-N-acetylfucosamine:lipid II N-acetylfucosaminyltransferase [Gammaproteobacteria bacterium]